ncbi:MAG TPA: hypothetical protein VII61_22550, partial [Ktedonobacteraceae bacterium]
IMNGFPTLVHVFCRMRFLSGHGIMNGFPTYASHTYMLLMKNGHWCREAIHNSVPSIRAHHNAPNLSHPGVTQP